jgi:hypothetical protein
MRIKVLLFIGSVLAVSSCVTMKPVALFDEVSKTPEPPHIENFYALSVLQEKLNSEVWFTPDPKCIKVTNAEKHYSGENSIHLKWDKQEGGCDWIGMGIGWDGWASKDLSMIMNKAAIQFKAYSEGGKKITSLPLAAAMEDYGGKQAWIGFAPKYISYQPGEEWATVTLPISEFGWEQFGADETNIKQMIIQFEAAGEVYFDEMKVVPFKGTLNKQYKSQMVTNPAFVLDGTPNEILWSDKIDLEGQSISVVGSSDYLYVSGSIVDKTPLLNTQTGDDVWNGDGLEIALSSNSDANPKRKQILLSDQHVCIKLGMETMVWDYQANIIVKNAEVVTAKTPTGYTFEAKIPYSHFKSGQLKSNTVYDFEVAINDGDGNKRIHQSRWNSAGIEGFHKNPSLWGNVTFKEVQP